MKIVAAQLTDKHLLLMIQSKYEGMTVRLHRDISVFALGKHLRELAEWLG